jgi:lipoyl(octanoyl) transferase
MTLICVLQLGTVDYSTGLRLQQKLVDLRKENSIGDVLLVLEHPPVITLGRNARAANVIASPAQLAEHGVKVVECDRGGDVTFHGPGQLVGYPIFDLRGFDSAESHGKTLGVIAYVRRVEQVLIRTCADFGIATERIAGMTGVWTNHEASEVPSGTDEGTGEDEGTRSGPAEQDSKIAAIGVHVSRGVTSHGFALNVNTDLRYFDLIIPCGITGKPVTSMERELHKTIPLQEVAHSISRNFGVVFESDMLWLESLDALLGGSVGVPMKPPPELRKIHPQERQKEETFWA